MNNIKGFTLIEIIAAVILLGIISIVAIVTYTGSMNEFRDSYYSSLERTLEESGKEFFEDNRNYRPSAIFGVQKVPISLLESKSYIDDVLDYNGSKCSAPSFGASNVKSSGNIIIKDNAGNTRACSYTVYTQAQSRTSNCNTYNERVCGQEEYNCKSCYYGSNTCSPGYIYGNWGSYSGCTYNPGTSNTDTRECVECGNQMLYQCRTRTKTYSSCATGSNTCRYGCDYRDTYCRKEEYGCEKWNPPSNWSDVNNCTPSTGNSSKIECQTVYRAKK